MRFKITMRYLHHILLVSLTVCSFQNCAPPAFDVQNAPDSLGSLGSNPKDAIPSCQLPDGSSVLAGETLTGYPMMTALYPMTCGQTRTLECLESGSFSGALPLYQSCQQQCVHPTTSQAVPSGTQFVYYTRGEAATTAECEAAKVTTSCSGETGLFRPNLPQTRFSACLVKGQTCAYPTGSGLALPTGNTSGATVVGFKSLSVTYPTLCGLQFTSTCQSTGQWSNGSPLYGECQQNCLHPDTQQPVASGQSLIYYTRSSGTMSECQAARVTSSCFQATGLFQPAIPATRFATCQIVEVPDVVTHEMLVGDDARYNVFKSSCVSCHNNSTSLGNLNLYSASQSATKASVILSRMKHENKNLSPMPTTGILDSYRISLVQKWVETGAQVQPPPTVAVNPFQCQSSTVTSLKPMRRLTRDEIRNVIIGLGSAQFVTSMTSSINTLIDDGVFKNLSDYQVYLSEDQVQSFQKLAEAAMDVISSNNTAYLQIAGNCFSNTSLATSCRDDFLNRIGLKAFRRPLTTEERNSFVSSYFNSNFTPREAVALSIYRILISPDFIFHLESGSPNATVSNSIALTQYEIASRLSFALWDAPPDDNLYAAAASNQLTTIDQVRAQFDRMVTDPRAKNKLMKFFRYWLLPKAYARETYSPTFLNEITDFSGTMTELNTEMQRFIEYIVWTKKGSFKDLLLDETSFATTTQAAQIYGHAPTTNLVTGAKMTGGRAGLLMRTPFLMTEGNETHPIIRGVKLRTRILCDDLGPPTGVLVGGEDLFSDQARALYSVRHRTTELTKTESCMACHSLINPLGFTFENFDNMGRYRTVERAISSTGVVLANHPIDSTVTAPLIDESTQTLTGARHLVETLVQGSKAPSCFLKQAHRYYQLQKETVDDGCHLANAYEKLRGQNYENAPILDVYRELVVSPQIFFRRVK